MARTLIVEDDAADNLLLYAIFEGSGHERYFARDGEQAFKAYLRNDIQVVMTDLHMPNVDGLELVESLLALYPEAAIIAVSGKGTELLAQANDRREGLSVFPVTRMILGFALLSLAACAVREAVIWCSTTARS